MKEIAVVTTESQSKLRAAFEMLGRQTVEHRIRERRHRGIEREFNRRVRMNPSNAVALLDEMRRLQAEAYDVTSDDLIAEVRQMFPAGV
jgi:hypothetical protein